MEKCITCCSQILDICDSSQHPLMLPLAVSAHVFYARPFERSQGVGKLSSDIVPEKYRVLHKGIMTFRDKVFAHTDADHDETAGHPMHDVVYSVIDGENIFSTSDPRIQPQEYKRIRLHAKRMREVFVKRVNEHHKRFNGLLPSKDGHYLFSLPAGSPLFEDYTVPELTRTLQFK